MTDRLEAMSLLVSAVDCGSFSAAARRLGMPLATISRRVSDLEARLGAPLLIRSARGLSLTDAGASYVAACRRILDDVAEIERIAAGEFTTPKGLLSITAPVVFGRWHVLPAVTEFLDTHSAVDARLALTDRPVNPQDEHIDVTVRIGTLADSSLRARKVGEVRRVICASPAYLAARGRPSSPEDLTHHNCVTFESLTQPNRWVFDHQSVQVRSRLAVNTAEAALDAAMAGLGVTRVLSYQAAPAVAAGHLQLLLEPFEPEPWPVNILYRSGPLPEKVRAFLDHLAPHLSAALTLAQGSRTTDRAASQP